MNPFRAGRLARATVLLLLSWTAIDLTNASLCALEQEQDALPIAASPISGKAVLASINDSSREIPPATPVHVDDCFCCSHCVSSTEVLTLPEHFRPLEPVCAQFLSPARTSPRALDHPPQLAK